MVVPGKHEAVRENPLVYRIAPALAIELNCGLTGPCVREIILERYVCIHGHFYQPPRENPWLEAIELQDSAYPYHDWNERITAECYAPNSASRILNGGNQITAIVNNYARISFNFGPTLLAWMERIQPGVLPHHPGGRPGEPGSASRGTARRWRRRTTT